MRKPIWKDIGVFVQMAWKKGKALFGDRKRKRQMMTGALVAACLIGMVVSSMLHPQDVLKQDAKEETKNSAALSEMSAENGDVTGDADGNGTGGSAGAGSEQSEQTAGEGVLGNASAAGKTDQAKGEGTRGQNLKDDAGNHISPGQQPTIDPQNPAKNPSQGQAGNGGNTLENNDGSTAEKQEITCSIEIRCDAVSGNDVLTANGYPQAEAYAKNKQIVARTVLCVKKGSTVYDVLSQVCREKGIALDAMKSAYGTYYVKGINNLYEFMAGGNSGWVYLVNNKSPNVGCSGYQLSDGEEIVWKYVVR